MSGWNEAIIREFRANAGAVGGPFEGAPLLLLHTVGRRTGRERVNPVMYLRDGDRWVVFATKGGSAADPDWLVNLEAHPDVSIEVGTETIPVRARVLRGEPERDELYRRQAALYPRFADYERRAAGHRTIPVAILERAG
jgi:deazaflavin-dependent oxidoreductase (nitroreductase family)